MFARINTKSKVTVISIVVAVLMLAYTAVYVGVGKVEGDVAAAADKMAADAQNQAQQTQTRAVVANTTSQQKQIATYALASDGVVSFIDIVESTARKVNLVETTNTVTTAPFVSVDAKKWEGLSIDISTDGSWADTYRFLSILEELPFRSMLARASIERADITSKDTTKESWHGDFMLVVLKRI